MVEHKFQSEYRLNTKLHYWLLTMLVVSVPLVCYDILCSYQLSQNYFEIYYKSPSSAKWLQWFQRNETILLIFHLTCTLPIMLVFFRWLYVMYKNLYALGLEGVEYSPGWAVGWFFVPIMNLFRPVQVIGELWRGSQPGTNAETWTEERVPSFIVVWWVVWVASGLSYNFLTSELINARPLPKELSQSVMLHILGSIAYLAAVILTAVLIHRIRKAQLRKLSEVGRGYKDVFS